MAAVISICIGPQSLIVLPCAANCAPTVYVQLGCIAQGLLQHLAIDFTAEVWLCFRSWLRTMNPAMPPSELVVANALRHSIPTLFSVPALAPGLTKIMEEYRRHDPPSEIYEVAA